MEPILHPQILDNDRIDDIVKYLIQQSICSLAWEKIVESTVQSINRDAPFMMMDRTWFTQDMDGDGFKNGPSDYDTDGDGMPDGFEYCYSHKQTIHQTQCSNYLTPQMHPMAMVIGMKME